MLKFYRCNCALWSCSRTIALSSSNDCTVILLGKDDGEIEFWSTSCWHRIKRWPGKHSSYRTCVTWCSSNREIDDRIIGTDLCGKILGYELSTGSCQLLKRLPCSIWSFVKDPSGRILDAHRFALACGDGVVRIISIKDKILDSCHCSSFTRVNARVLCVTWLNTSETLLAGDSKGTIWCWDVKSRKVNFRIAQDSQKTIFYPVWTLLSLNDDTVVSGYSNGSVRWYNGISGVLTAHSLRHNADVLALAATSNGEKLFSAGADCQVAKFSRGKQGSSVLWLYSTSKRPHTKAIHALAIVGYNQKQSDLLLSGGEDSFLMAYSIYAYAELYPLCVCQTIFKPILTMNNITIKASGRSHELETSAKKEKKEKEILGNLQLPLLMFMYPSYIDLWICRNTGKTVCADELIFKTRREDNLISSEYFTDLTNLFQSYARIRKSGEDFLLTAALSASRSYIAYSDINHLRLFSITFNQSTTSAETMPGYQHDLPMPTIRDLSLLRKTQPANRLIFTPDSCKLISISISGSIFVIESSSALVLWHSNFYSVKSSEYMNKVSDKSSDVISLDVSYDSQWCAFSHHHGLYIFNLQTYQCYKQIV
eukprot:gnl/MRDRNA2_/MRDRNA2_86772_c0_seq3.p1 gnl/MRDRNA2_/MRDRNA2_86772_c0~~gnl/MRDRNA2_/MRDRNA2_86772_c0_seq3.p1  ORF type:complete len:595 (+),score=-0.69 gnl/MRDRNA2_/MRDRNA2_86772_c0_seq3:57-1841(+)